ncbi:TRAP transporter substrate-binding protein [Verminephrobacter aporrectodeae]|uniref:TRAP transporter substrate-binding protein n=1 Tax=Verminephrobacter aporrectodeae TaxID=1110389 RepID=UPI00023781D6|nr:TRAP transporter substrate-binding protein [Verminephrobacter aporrectodeae]
MKRRRILPATALALALALAATPVWAQVKWDLAAAYPASNFHTENMAQLASEVDKATGGQLKITVHANAALFKAPEIKRAVQGGQVQMGEVLLGNFQNEWQIFGIDSLPFLADSYEAAKKLYAAQKPFLEKKLAEQGMLLLYSVAWPPQGIGTKKTLRSAADLRGVKWRTYSPATARLAQLLGAQPVTVQAAELSQALATGVVEATMSSSATGMDNKIYEHLKYYYDTRAWLPKNAVLVNKKAFDALDKPLQQALLKAGTDADARGWSTSTQVNTDTTAKLKAHGMKIVEPPAALRADLARAGESMLKEWIATTGPEGQALIDAYRR